MEFNSMVYAIQDSYTEQAQHRNTSHYQIFQIFQIYGDVL